MTSTDPIRFTTPLYTVADAARSPTRASRLVQELIDAGHLRRGADQGDGRVSLITFTKSGRHFAEKVRRTFEDSVKKYFVDPLDDDDIAAITRIWAKLENAQRPA